MNRFRAPSARQGRPRRSARPAPSAMRRSLRVPFFPSAFDWRPTARSSLRSPVLARTPALARAAALTGNGASALAASPTAAAAWALGAATKPAPATHATRANRQSKRPGLRSSRTFMAWMLPAQAAPVSTRPVSSQCHPRHPGGARQATVAARRGAARPASSLRKPSLARTQGGRSAPHTADRGRRQAPVCSVREGGPKRFAAAASRQRLSRRPSTVGFLKKPGFTQSNASV